MKDAEKKASKYFSVRLNDELVRRLREIAKAMADDQRIAVSIVAVVRKFIVEGIERWSKA